MPEGLWERDDELRALDAALSATVHSTGQLVVIEGPSGVGKSQLLRAARREAGARGLPVLAARGMELEREVPFALARQLFVPPLLRASEGERSRLLMGPATLAKPLLGESAATDALMGEGQAGALVEGLYWLAVNLAHETGTPAGSPGLVVIVDDAQWADRSSLRFLVHAVGQLEEIALCVLVAIRTGEPEAPEDLLGRLRAHRGVVRLRPAALSAVAVDEVVRAHGFPKADDEFCRACATVSGGNPFLLTELLTVLLADGLEPNSQAAHRVSELLPDSVLDAVVINLGRLPNTAAQLAAAVAVLDEAPLALAAELAELDLQTAEAAADTLSKAHVLSPGEPLSFVHPLIGAAVLADLAPSARARAHRRAAELLQAHGATPGRIAVHLLDVRPQADPWVCATLLDAGRDALVHGEPRSAIRFLHRAFQEPPAAEQRAATLITLAQAEAADDSPHAVARLVEALENVGDPHQRAEAYNQLSRLLFFKGDIAQAADAAERGLGELDPADPMMSHLLSAQLTAATFDATLRPRVTDRLGPYLEEARAGRIPKDPLICCHLGARMAISGDPAAIVLPVVEQAFARHPMVDETAHGVVLAFPIVSLVMLDELDRASAALESALRTDRARSSLIALTVTYHWWSVVEFRRGQLVAAEGHGQRALAACGNDDWRLYGPWIAANLAQIRLERGDIEGARATLERGHEETVDPVGRCLLLEASGRVAAAADDAEHALELFTTAGRMLDAMGLFSPGFIPWRSNAALALSRLGEQQKAIGLVEDELVRARRVGSRRAIGAALRVAGLVGREESRLALLSESCETLQGAPGRLEHARSLAELGAAMRRAGRRVEAREPLRQALDTAVRAGADPLVQRVREELAAAGSRPRRTSLTGADSLTPTERRIAQLAAENRTNAQIAHDLYVTSKTVEWHLGNVFRKLHIATRSQLADAL